MAFDAKVMKALRSIVIASKSIPSEDLEKIEDVMDIYNEPNGQHAVPAEGKIKTGPSEDASGEGAFKMVRQYSNPAKQTVATEAYDTFSKYLEGFAAAQKAQGDQIAVLAEALLAKGAPASTASDDSFLSKAETRLAVASKALRKADMADDEEEKEEKEEHLEKAEKALAVAKRLLAKAESEHEEDLDEEKEEAVEKALASFKKLSKALVKAKADLAVKKSEVKDEKAHEKEGEAEKEAERAIKEAEKEHVAETKKAAERLDLLEKSVQDVLSTIAGVSKSTPVPDFVKSMATETISDRIETAIEDGELSMPEVMKARDILGRISAAKLGQYDGDKLQAAIAEAPERVRSLFKNSI